MSSIRLSRAYIDGMLKRNSGRIIFVSSESGGFIPDEMVHYGVTKTAQIAIARGLAEMTKGTNVTVNSVLPGPTLSEGVGNFVEQLAIDQNITTAQVKEIFSKRCVLPPLSNVFYCPKKLPIWLPISPALKQLGEINPLTVLLPPKTKALLRRLNAICTNVPKQKSLK